MFYFSDPTIARKDLNFIEANMKISLSNSDAKEFWEQIESDSKFFEQNNIIDYSLLLGIHYRNKDAKKTGDPNQDNLLHTVNDELYPGYKSQSFDNLDLNCDLSFR